jgi:hypothetical protein
MFQPWKNLVWKSSYSWFITQSNATTIITFMRPICSLQFSNIKIGAYYVGSSEEGGLHFDDNSHVFCMKQIIQFSLRRLIKTSYDFIEFAISFATSPSPQDHLQLH